MKRIIPILIMVSMLLGVTAFADDLPTVFITNAETTGTNDITVSISASENTPFCGGSMNLVYDNTLLRAKSYKTSDLLSGCIANVNLEYTDNNIRFSWAGTEEITSGGILFDVTFEVIAMADFETDITIDKLKLGDIDGEKIEAVSENGHIKYVKETSSSTTTGRHSGKSSGGTTTLNPNQSNETNAETQNTPSNMSFSDVKESDWYYSYVKTVYEQGLIKGISDTEFAPNEKLTRAMFVTILYRMDREPDANQSAFADVEKDSWYEKAVAWASANGIVQGVSNTEFAPNTNITREQMAAIIFRYAKYKGIDTEEVTKDTNTLSHNDVFDVSDWAKDAMHYSIAAGVINGDENGNLLPHNTATRAETSAVITRLIF